MSITHIRNATQRIDYAGKRFFIDSMLADKDAWLGSPGTARSELHNPLVELPPFRGKIINVDAVTTTRIHDDHWNVATIAAIPKTLPVLVQHEADAVLLRDQGFQDLRLLSADSESASVHLQKTTSGQHSNNRVYAAPVMARRLEKARGVVFCHPQEKTLWLMGDVIWRDDIAAGLLKLRPDVMVLNTGYTHVTGFGLITMGKKDLLNVHFTLPGAKIMAIHLEAVNHCLVSRGEMRQYVLDNQIVDVVSIP